LNINTIWADTAGGGFTVTLPDSLQLPDGSDIVFKNVAVANNLTVSCIAGQNIDGVGSIILGPGVVAWLRTHGTAWRRLVG
jgi:hypothetical protein